MMKRIIVLIILLLALVAAGVALAADGVDTLGTAVKGQDYISLNINAGRSLSYTDPGVMGFQSYIFTGSPIEIELIDNDVNPVASASFLNVKISSELPAQYGSDKVYQIHYIAGFSPLPDSELTVDDFEATGQLYLTGEDQSAMYFGGSPVGTVLHASVNQTASLVINANKRLAGDTSDSLIILYTFIDF